MKVNGTFANFVDGELICFVLDILNGRKVEVPGNAAILFIQELHCLSRNVNHACCQQNTQETNGVKVFPV